MPTSPRLADIRARAQRGDWQQAEAQCRAVLAEGPDDAAARALLATILFQSGKADEATGLLDTVRAAEPDTAAWASDLGFALLLAGEADPARAWLDRALALPGADGVAFNRAAAVTLALGDLDRAEALFGEALLRDPDRPEIVNNLAGVMVRREKLEDALALYERAIAIAPDEPAYADRRAGVLVSLQRTDEVVAELEEDLRTQDDGDATNAIDLRRRLARILICAERYQDAEDHLRAASAADPDDAAIRLELGMLALRQDRFIVAVRQFKKAVELDDETVTARIMLARALSELGMTEDAEATVKELEDRHPDLPAVRIARAELLLCGEREEEAVQTLRAIVDDFPGSAEAWLLLGNALLTWGRKDEASDCFERAAVLNPLAFASMIQARSFPDDPERLSALEDLASLPLLPVEARAAAGFALATAHDKKGDPDKAFEFARQANAHVRNLVPYRARAQSLYMDRIIEAFADEGIFKRLRLAGNPSTRPVFVFGMPRSGTTLTEQIIASHPKAVGAGELSTVGAITRLMPRVLETRAPYPLCLDRITERTVLHAAAYYLEALRALDDDAERVVDKMPHNFPHLGLMALMFPNAKFIHLNRDPRDVAISNFFANFKARNGTMGFAFDLADIGHMINDHDRIMAHWRRVLPVPVFELSYESLVTDFEATARALLDFVGLAWDDAVLAFHKTDRPVRTASVAQVREPIYTSSTARWKRYEKHLGPLLDVLGTSPE